MSRLCSEPHALIVETGKDFPFMDFNEKGGEIKILLRIRKTIQYVWY